MNGLDGAKLMDVKGTERLTGYNREASVRLLVVRLVVALNQPVPTRIRALC